MTNRSFSRPATAPLVAAVLSFPLFAWFFFTLPSIPDLDSYYHLAVAKLYRTHGLVAALPWARFSILGRHLGDKELLFHVFLIPFSGSSAGGRIALALVNAALVGVIGWIATRITGRWGFIIPLWMFGSSGAFFFRTFRLRPEACALLLLLVFVWALAEEKAVIAGVVAAVFALSYTAVHVVAGLAAIVFFVIAALERRWRWKILLYPLAGAAAGLLLHPHFPDNLRIFWIQNAVFFLRKSALDVGEEITAPAASDVLLYNLGWWIGLLLLWQARTRVGNGLAGHSQPLDERASGSRRRTMVFAAAAVVFTVLYVGIERMAIYAIPFITLALLSAIGERGPLTGSVTIGRARLPLVVMLAICVAASAPYTSTLIGAMRDVRTGVATHEYDWRAFAQAVPPGARVAAPWGSAEAFCFWAPQGRYLDVLDPVFMAVACPVQFHAQRAVFEGAEPDVPFVTTDVLQSDYLAFRSGDAAASLVARLRKDPRMQLRFVGERNVLVEFVDGANAGFVLDWSIADPRDARRLGRYRRPGSEAAKRREGFIELTNAADVPCLTSIHRIANAVPVARTYEFAPYGTGELWVDDALVARDGSSSGATLGRGVQFPLSLAPGNHVITVRTCRGKFSRRNGFYLVDRGPSG